MDGWVFDYLKYNTSTNDMTLIVDLSHNVYLLYHNTHL